MSGRKAKPAHNRIQTLLGLSLELRENLPRARAERLQGLLGALLDVVTHRVSLVEEAVDDLLLILAEQFAGLLASSCPELFPLGLEAPNRFLNLSEHWDRRRFGGHFGNPPCCAFG